MKKTEFITQDLLSKIFQHSFISGKLPNQRALAQQYSVSRDTIQKALHQLKDMGIIRSIQGDGIYIKTSALQNPLIYNSLTKNSYSHIQSKVIFLNKIRASIEDQRTFNLKDGQYIWVFQRIRIVNLRIVQIETSKMPFYLFQDLNETVLEHSIQKYVQGTELDISHYITSYTPIVIDKNQAELLQCKPHLPAMKIINRCLLKDGKLYEYCEVIAIDYSATYLVPFNKKIHSDRQKDIN